MLEGDKASARRLKNFKLDSKNRVLRRIALVNDQNSQAIATVVDVTLFDKPFDDIVARAIEYRKKYKRPIGKEHIDDVFGHILDDEKHKSHQQYRRIIEGISFGKPKASTTAIYS